MQVIRRFVVEGEITVIADAVERVEANDGAEAVRVIAGCIARPDVKVAKHLTYDGWFVGGAPWRYSDVTPGEQIPAVQIVCGPEPEGGAR